MSDALKYNCGLGLRSEFIHEVEKHDFKPSWFEVTPENWMSINIKHRKAFEQIVSDYEIAAHGLSLSIGSNTPLDKNHLKNIKTFLDDYEIEYTLNILVFVPLITNNSMNYYPFL